jgi:hypothetical protein
MDTPEIIIIALSALTAVVWVHSWILDGNEGNAGRENRPEERVVPLYHGEAMLGVEEF